jgi:hypothetical protein
VCRAITEGIVAGLSPQRPEIFPRSTHAGEFVIEEVPLEEVYHSVLFIPRQYHSCSMLITSVTYHQEDIGLENEKVVK